MKTCAETLCGKEAKWRDSDNLEWCDKHRHSLVARISSDTMNTYTVVLVPPTGYKQKFVVRAEYCSSVDANGRSWLHFSVDGSNVRTIVIGQGMSYFMSGVDSEGNEVSIPK